MQSPWQGCFRAQQKKHRSHRWRHFGLLADVVQKLCWLNITKPIKWQNNFFHGLLYLVVQWSYDVFWLFNECCNGFSMFYGQSGSLNHCINFHLDVSPANASIRWRCLFPTPTTFAVQQRRVSGNRPIAFTAHNGVLAPEQIEFDWCGVNFTHCSNDRVSQHICWTCKPKKLPSRIIEQ